MELKEIGEALGIDNRVMRYLMEQDIVPGLKKVNKGRGTRRNMSTAQARLVAVAAIIHELGFRGPIVQLLLGMTKEQLQAEKKKISVRYHIKNGGFNLRVDITIPLGKSFYEKVA